MVGLQQLLTGVGEALAQGRGLGCDIVRASGHRQVPVLDGEPGKRYAKLIEEKTGIMILGYWGGSSRNVLSTKKPVLSMDDMKGFRLRLISSPLK